MSINVVAFGLFLLNDSATHFLIQKNLKNFESINNVYILKTYNKLFYLRINIKHHNLKILKSFSIIFCFSSLIGKLHKHILNNCAQRRSAYSCHWNFMSKSNSTQTKHMRNLKRNFMSKTSAIQRKLLRNSKWSFTSKLISRLYILKRSNITLKRGWTLMSFRTCILRSAIAQTMVQIYGCKFSNIPALEI